MTELGRRQFLPLGGVFDFPAKRFDGFAELIALGEILGLANGGALIKESLYFGGDDDGSVAETEDGIESYPRSFDFTRLSGSQLTRIESLVRFADQLKKMSERIVDIEVVGKSTIDLLAECNSGCENMRAPCSGRFCSRLMRMGATARLPLDITFWSRSWLCIRSWCSNEADA